MQFTPSTKPTEKIHEAVKELVKNEDEKVKEWAEIDRKNINLRNRRNHLENINREIKERFEN